MTNEEAMDVLRRNYPSSCFEDLCEAVDIAIKALSAEPERKTGQWLPSRDRDYNECSCCHRITEPQVVAYKFCPYCGAEMRGEENDRDGKMPRVFLF